MKKVLLLLLVAFGAWHWYQQRPTGYTGNPHDKIIMYSLTTCGYCTQKRKQLTAEKIPFNEYFIDRDLSRRDELTHKLQQAGIRAQAIGTPTFDVHGKMLINNPPLEKIREAMSRPGQKS